MRKNEINRKRVELRALLVAALAAPVGAGCGGEDDPAKSPLMMPTTGEMQQPVANPMMGAAGMGAAGMGAMEPMQPDPMQPDPMQPDPMQPDPMQPDPMQPDPMQPDPMQPDPMQPDPMQPDPMQPDPMPDGDCYCRGEAPTEASATAMGPYNHDSYTQGFRNGPDFGGATIYYPTDAEPPFGGIIMCPGFTARQSSIAAWGPFFASHGIVLVTIDTNTTGDPVTARDDALLDALESLKAENSRSGSPLEGKLSMDRFGVSGWSMGGGGTWLAAASTPELKTAMTLAGHNATAGGGRIASGITVPTIMFAGRTDTAILGGGQSQPAYEAIPDSTPKILYEFASEGHFSWGSPRVQSGALGRYALSWQKVFLEGDDRYREFLLEEGPGASDWRSTFE